MSTVSIFIFDEIFESMVGANGVSDLQKDDAELHLIQHKCRITDYEPINNPATQKIVCINPDFVDWHFSADEYRQIPGLKMIISSSDNISWLDTSYADVHDIKYVALESLTTEYSAVAEYAVTIMMSLARKIPQLIRDSFPLDYAHDFVKYQGMDIAGKTVGIIGLGNIGGAIAKLCNGLGMNVIYWSRSRKPEGTYEYREIENLLRVSDVIFPALKPNSETRGILPNERLGLIKDDAIVVSVVDGLFDTNYVAKRISEGKLFGFGFGADPGTFSDYGGNVWAIPDYAWATKGNMQASYDQLIAKIRESIKQFS